MLELTGRVELSVRLPSMWTSFHLCLTDLVDGEGEWPHLWDPHALADLSWPFEVGPLELEGFLVEVELGHFRIDVLELHPEPWWGPPLPPEHLALGYSTGVLGVTALGGDCFTSWAAWPTGRKELAVWGSHPDMVAGVSPTT